LHTDTQLSPRARAIRALSSRFSAAYQTAADASGSFALDGSPGIPAANSRTDTVYVPIQCAQSFCPQNGAPGAVVDLIDAATCNARTSLGCKVVARAKVGSMPLATAVDQRTDTIYVANGDGTVSVVDGAHCNASVTTGCASPVAAITVGGFPVAATFNPSTRTVYLANVVGQVDVLDVTHCNSKTTSGCANPVKMIADSLIPDGIDVNVATDTVYAANGGPTGNGNTLSVIDGSLCNATTSTGCGRTPRTVLVGTNPFWDTVDPATNTIYVANNGNNGSLGSVSVVNGVTCNAKVTTGCGQIAPAITTGTGTGFVAVDAELHTAFALNGNDDTVSAINTDTCNGGSPAGCPQLAPAELAAPNIGRHFLPEPNAFAQMTDTGSFYLVSIGGPNALTVRGTGNCNATTTSGCRKDAPSVPAPDYLPAVDPSTNTIYASNLNLPQIDVFNGATCRAGDISGCTPVGVIPFAHTQANFGSQSIDPDTHTLYAADPFANFVAAIDISTCNAVDTSGCGLTPSTMTIGPNPGPPVVDPATHTLYTNYGNLNRFNKVAVDNAATCNAQVTTGCAQTAAVVTVAPINFVLAISVKTDTIYAPSVATNTVSIINGATCNASDHSGCGHLAGAAKVGTAPFPVSVDDSTGTVYVGNTENGEAPGTLSVIATARCDGSNTAGCAGPFPSVVVGRSPIYALTDVKSDTTFVADSSGASVAVLDGATCNATTTTGCKTPAPERAVGSQPQSLAFNPASGTVYTFCLPGSQTMSVFKP
jgi:DNA-binding beta-propeller fold protein YncE